MSNLLSVCNTYCDEFISESEVKFCVKFWEIIQKLCCTINNCLKLVRYEQNEQLIQNLLISLARVESLRKLLKKEEIVNMELTSLDDVLEIGMELKVNLNTLSCMLSLGTTIGSNLIVLTHRDREEWEYYQIERSNVSRKLDYCFAISSIPGLKDYIFKDNLSDQEVDLASNLISYFNISDNPIVKAFAQIQNDRVAARQEFYRIRESTDRGFFEAKVKIMADKIEIGSGSGGNVYKTIFNGRSVAIKQLRCGVMEYRVEKEVSAMAALNKCANVVKLVGYYTENFIHSIVMNFYQYGSLFNLLHPEWNSSTSFHSTTLTAETKLQIAIGVANGLAAIHKLRLVHRDLKSPNVLMDGGFNAVITDFDLVKFEGSGRLAATLSENTKKNINSIYWRAPETLRPTLTFSKKSDIWALGVIIWEIYKGKIPFYPEQEFELLEAYIKHNELSKDLEGIEGPIREIIRDCLKPNSVERPTAEKLLISLKKVREHQL